jgi:GrpB-like predicted nucleotidyltransferase (UPF0157 family)
MADSILLRPYDPAWPVKFESAEKELLSQFPDQFLAIEHIGSTAIPEISAKPIIDILGGVESMKAADKLNSWIVKSRLGYLGGVQSKHWRSPLSA